MIDILINEEKFWGIQKDRLESIKHKKIIFIGKKMTYECERCGEVRYMLLEKGLEETLNGKRKPVPFTIVCPKCFSLMRHVNWNEDVQYVIPGEHILGESYGDNLFVDISGCDCGVPIFSETLDGLIPSLGEIHARTETNRAERRAMRKHPMWEETRYKRRTQND